MDSINFMGFSDDFDTFLVENLTKLLDSINFFAQFWSRRASNLLDSIKLLTRGPLKLSIF